MRRKLCWEIGVETRNFGKTWAMKTSANRKPLPDVVVEEKKKRIKKERGPCFIGGKGL